jgi:hypothetical protein
MNEFRDDELYLSRQAFKRATSSQNTSNEVALMEKATLYTSLRERTWIWWCNLVQSCCVEFTTRFPRVWEDFEYTQRSLWEYFAQLEIGLREYHFQECLAGIDEVAADTSDLVQQSTSHQGLPENGVNVKTYRSSLDEYLNFSVSVSSRAFLKGYLRGWKIWLESRDEKSSRNSFLEGEEDVLEKCRLDDYGRPLLVREIELY